jgi:uncharacterized damage-inducible protein DinB
MTEVARILDQLRRAWNGECWAGPSLWSLLADVTVGQANARPIAGSHTIAEIVGHLAYWRDAVCRRLAGQTVLPSHSEQWPAGGAATETQWRLALSVLESRQRSLDEAISRLSDAKLSTAIGGKPYDFYVCVHGLIQHDLYHAGQIALLKKAAAL